MRVNKQAPRIQSAIDDAWLGKVEINLALAEETVRALTLLEKIAHYARNLQLAESGGDSFDAAWDLTDALDQYYGRRPA